MLEGGNHLLNDSSEYSPGASMESTIRGWWHQMGRCFTNGKGGLAAAARKTVSPPPLQWSRRYKSFPFAFSIASMAVHKELDTAHLSILLRTDSLPRTLPRYIKDSF